MYSFCWREGRVLDPYVLWGVLCKALTFLHTATYSCCCKHHETYRFTKDYIALCVLQGPLVVVAPLKLTLYE